ncbi:uncharacterized protein MYCFIDRAFT_181236 [Pseudocercospora fijiensis CIRAD86]|uniref:Uncharacterized protein n=1 Tax=Pseudocercospora fijiensis (strain CIRAD86) TaxID=383855 RepID=N1QBA6_PSEFD|nr:uncharacterized protein MYCFIDRAFT_181236 [Pseudocercospora fijiensis CIRAD86]EME88388.1 hypothetical protein MYCFIDRAFT_181236 [Pseudocercospora fijiensis CIRAD86]
MAPPDTHTFHTTSISTGIICTPFVAWFCRSPPPPPPLPPLSYQTLRDAHPGIPTAATPPLRLQPGSAF